MATTTRIEPQLGHALQNGDGVHVWAGVFDSEVKVPARTLRNRSEAYLTLAANGDISLVFAIYAYSSGSTRVQLPPLAEQLGTSPTRISVSRWGVSEGRSLNPRGFVLEGPLSCIVQNDKVRISASAGTWSLGQLLGSTSTIFSDDLATNRVFLEAFSAQAVGEEVQFYATSSSDGSADPVVGADDSLVNIQPSINPLELTFTRRDGTTGNAQLPTVELGGLLDVSFQNAVPTGNQVLTFDAIEGKWTAADLPPQGAQTLPQLDDVSFPIAPEDGQSLIFNADDGVWEAGDAALTSFAAHTDTDIASALDGQGIIWNTALQTWEARDVVQTETVTSAVVTATNEITFSDENGDANVLDLETNLEDHTDVVYGQAPPQNPTPTGNGVDVLWQSAGVDVGTIDPEDKWFHNPPAAGDMEVTNNNASGQIVTGTTTSGINYVEIPRGSPDTRVGLIHAGVAPVPNTRTNDGFTAFVQICGTNDVEAGFFGQQNVMSIKTTNIVNQPIIIPDLVLFVTIPNDSDLTRNIYTVFQNVGTSDTPQIAAPKLATNEDFATIGIRYTHSTTTVELFYDDPTVGGAGTYSSRVIPNGGLPSADYRMIEFGENDRGTTSGANTRQRMAGARLYNYPMGDTELATTMNALIDEMATGNLIPVATGGTPGGTTLAENDILVRNANDEWTNQQLSAVISANETTTSLAATANPLQVTFTDETGTVNTVNLVPAAETTTSLAATANPLQVTFTDETGTANVVDITPPALEGLSNVRTSPPGADGQHLINVAGTWTPTDPFDVNQTLLFINLADVALSSPEDGELLILQVDEGNGGAVTVQNIDLLSLTSVIPLTNLADVTVTAVATNQKLISNGTGTFENRHASTKEIVQVTSNQTIVQENEVAFVDTSTVAITVTLASAFVDGSVIVIKDAQNNASVNNITVSTSGADTFEDGTTSFVINVNRQSQQFIFNSGVWYFI